MKKRVTSKAKSLQSLTKAELYKKAAAAHVPGRSTMTHDQLVDALTDAAGGGSDVRPTRNPVARTLTRGVERYLTGAGIPKSSAPISDDVGTDVRWRTRAGRPKTAKKAAKKDP